MNDEPQDPFTELTAGAHQIHELYSAYVGAGFTEYQALELIKAAIIAGANGGAQ